MTGPNNGKSILIQWVLGLAGSVFMAINIWTARSVYIQSLEWAEDRAKDIMIQQMLTDVKIATQQIVGRSAYDRDQDRHIQDHIVLNGRINGTMIDVQELKIKIAEFNLKIAELKNKP